MAEIKLTNNFQQYANYLVKQEGFDIHTARKFAERMQAFHNSGLTAKEHAEKLYNKNKDVANSFLSNYGLYNQFLTTNLFGELMPMRRELRKRHLAQKEQKAN